MLNYSGVLLVV